MFVYLRNEFDFWKVHGIMNTAGLLQSKLCRRPEVFIIPRTFQKLIYCLDLHFIVNILNI